MVLARAGYVVGVFTKGASVRKAVEEMGASLVIIDTSAGGRAPSEIPVLVIGPDDALPRPAQKRALLESTRALLASFDDAGSHGGGRQKWSRRSRA